MKTARSRRTSNGAMSPDSSSRSMNPPHWSKATPHSVALSCANAPFGAINAIRHATRSAALGRVEDNDIIPAAIFDLGGGGGASCCFGGGLLSLLVLLYDLVESNISKPALKVVKGGRVRSTGL